MPCTPSPAPKIPSAPASISLKPPIPEPSIPDVPGVPCCAMPTLPAPSLPQLFPANFINPAFMALMHAGLDALEAWADSIAFPCPRS